MAMNFKRIRNKPPPGMKRVGDWKGLQVRTRKELRNGWGVIPAGTVCKVDHVGNGLDLEAVACQCCGVKMTIRCVPSCDVELLETAP